MFRVGQKVVCVDDNPNGDSGVFPKEGSIYTVSWCSEWYNPISSRALICVRLAEINRPKSRLGFVFPYRATRFRPVVERETDISVFQKMLTDHRLPALADTSRETA